MGEGKNLDPRIRRTRQLLQDALLSLLLTKSLDQISVQDITEKATLNRATFYAHYPDKFALLEATASARVAQLLERRSVSFDGTCTSAFRKILLGVCDYLELFEPSQEPIGLSLESHMESAIIASVRALIVDGLLAYPAERPVSQEMLATTVSWALYGACKEWAMTRNREPAETMVDGVAALLARMVHPL